jgi:predicted nucleotidyltransferase
MYSPIERDSYLQKTIERLSSSGKIEGIVQIGSGVNGYNDEFSDIDLMVAAPGIEDLSEAKDFVHRTLSDFRPLYIKVKKLRENVYLLIAVLEDSLEFNVSIVPIDFLKVKSPLWKVIFDKNGLVAEKMNVLNEQFNNQHVKYEVDADLVFEFVYSAVRLEKELQRKNLIYALKMLEKMRDYTLQVQSLNENKKLHQFKAFDTLNPDFIEAYLSTYHEEMNAGSLAFSAGKLKELFIETVKQSAFFSLEPALEQLLNLPIKK